MNKSSEMVQYLWNVYPLQSLSLVNQASGAIMSSITNYLSVSEKMLQKFSKLHKKKILRLKMKTIII